MMKQIWHLHNFRIIEIKEYVIKRALESDTYLLEEMLDLLEESYCQLKKDDLWYEVGTDMTYKGVGWISKPSQSPNEEDLLVNREEVLEWVFGHEVYCDIARRINIRRMG